MIERYKQAVFLAVPDLPKTEIAWRFHFMLGAISYAIAGTGVLRVVAGLKVGNASATESGQQSEAKILWGRLMLFRLAGLRAHLPPPPAASEN